MKIVEYLQKRRELKLLYRRLQVAKELEQTLVRCRDLVNEIANLETQLKYEELFDRRKDS